MMYSYTEEVYITLLTETHDKHSQLDNKQTITSHYIHGSLSIHLGEGGQGLHKRYLRLWRNILICEAYNTVVRK